MRILYLVQTVTQMRIIRNCGKYVWMRERKHPVCNGRRDPLLSYVKLTVLLSRLFLALPRIVAVIHRNSSALEAAFDEPVPLSPVTNCAAFAAMGMALLHLHSLNSCGA
jgi:hypothetical protein